MIAANLPSTVTPQSIAPSSRETSRPTARHTLTRSIANPILTFRDVPYEATLIFNAGVCKYQGQYVMVFRNDVGEWGAPRFDERRTVCGLATSADGIAWKVHAAPVFSMRDAEIRRAYDPRLTVVDGQLCMCFAIDTDHGIRGGIATSDNLIDWNVLSMSTPDNRNMVLFPERVNGKFARLERPMPVYSRGGDRFDIWYGDSPDLAYWGNHQLVLGVEQVPYANDKLGPAAPPVRTSRGWLTTFHSVERDSSRGKNGWEKSWQKRYSAGLMLLDLEQPWRVIAMCREPILTPQMPYECDDGFRTHVVFPGGMILEDTGEVKIYYGAADSVMCLATAHVDDLLALCEPI